MAAPSLQSPGYVNRILRREMLAFFTTLQTPELNWPAVPTNAILEGLADTLLEWGQQKGMHSSALRVLILELQDRLPAPAAAVPLTGHGDAGRGATAMLYPHCTLEIYFEGAPAIVDVDCKVEISATRCILTYDEEATPPGRLRCKQWFGFAASEGHYEMREAEGGHATLHRLAPHSAFLEGFWKEDGYTGMWRVRLGATQPR